MAATRRNLTPLGPRQTLFHLGAIGDLTDGQLLERFARRGEAAELAFAALVERHGPLVLHACRSILRHEHEAEDAFQATFLVLVRKARSLWVRDSLAPWLHQVACRAARCTRSAAARRTARERGAAEAASARRDGRGAGAVEELHAAIHEEIERLPERYRGLLVLCDLEGRTYEQAARHLGCPVGTVKSRLARGRQRLGERLTRRGLGLATALPAGRSVPPSLLAGTTTQAALRVAAGRPPAEVVSAGTTAVINFLTRGWLMNIRNAITTAAAVGALAGGLAWAGHLDPGAPPPTAAPRPAPGRAEAPAAAALKGQWQVLYLTGTVAGKREGYPVPGLTVPVTDTTANLPALTGDPNSPITYLGAMPYLLAEGQNSGAIDLKAGLPGGKPLKGIYRLDGDVLTICHGGPGGDRPPSFACDGPAECLIVLRHERPEPAPVRGPGGGALPPTGRGPGA